MDTGAATEQVRVLNFLQMFENGAMGDVTQATTMRALPLMCKTVLDIRKLNRKLINQLEALKWRSFKEGSYPDQNEEILMQLDCDRIILSYFDIEDTETLKQEGVVRWFRFPTPELYVIDDPIMEDD